MERGRRRQPCMKKIQHLEVHFGTCGQDDGAHWEGAMSPFCNPSPCSLLCCHPICAPNMHPCLHKLHNTSILPLLKLLVPLQVRIICCRSWYLRIKFEMFAKQINHTKWSYADDTVVNLLRNLEYNVKCLKVKQECITFCFFALVWILSNAVISSIISIVTN